MNSIVSGQKYVETSNPTHLRVLQFCTNFKKGGGIQNHVMGLSVYLRLKGHNVWFAGEAANSGLDETERDFLSLDMHQISETTGKVSIVKRVLALLRASSKLRTFLRRHGIQLIHAHETAPALVARLATLGTNVKTIMTFHGSAPTRLPSAAKTGQRCADLVASPSKTCLKNLISNGLNPKKARVFGLGIPPMIEASAETIRDVRNQYVRQPDDVMIFSASRLSHQKGIDVMIDVAARVVAKHPNAYFVVAGDGVLANQVTDWAVRAGVSENIIFMGRVDNVNEHLQASDVFLLTSRWEAFPISIVEAFRAGRPVVATRCGGVEELVDGEVGRLCEVEDVEALSDAICALVDSPSQRVACGVRARHRSQNARFDPESVHADIEKEYAFLADPVKALMSYQFKPS